jgi:hypothetical protein
MTTSADKPSGQLFTHVYLDRSTTLADSELFRRRLGSYCFSDLKDYHSGLATFLKKETGISVPWAHGFWNWEGLFTSVRIEYVLNLITLIHRFLKVEARQYSRTGQWISLAAQMWHSFVDRALREENVAYCLDAECGVHFLVDEEFHRNRAATIKCLEKPRYAAVRTAYELAHSYLDASPQDTKACVRSAFEALEILTKLIVETKNLNRWVVENKLTSIAISKHGSDPTAVSVIKGQMAGLADWVHAIHNYRHGQGTEEPIAPPLDLTILWLSTVAANLRYLVTLDVGSK